MSTSIMPVSDTWSLRHAWHSESDLAALTLCREELRTVGVALIDEEHGEECGVVKMHGMDIADAWKAQPAALQDLRAVAVEAGWAQQLPEFMRRHMSVGDCWYGIPLGIHQSNRVWVNPDWAEKVGAHAPRGLPELVSWLARVQRHLAAPLAVGCEPWQIGVIFEAMVLATGGSELYCRAFIEAQPTVWQDPAMLQALEYLMVLRTYVDDRTLKCGWAFHQCRVQRGEAAIQFMGDWARLAGGLLEWPAPGTDRWFLAIADYFVPLDRTPGSTAARAARKLTDPAFQRRFAARKGCLPAIRPAPSGIDQSLPAPGQLLPSLAFDQCCPTPIRKVVLETVATHFVDRSSAIACARALVQAVL